MRYSLLLRPIANGRYEAAMRVPLVNELSLILSSFGIEAAFTFENILGINAVSFECAPLSADVIKAVSLFSHGMWLCERTQTGFIPVSGEAEALLGRDLPLILKYKGKTNEYFTAMLMNLCVFASKNRNKEKLTLLDPMCGKGTALFIAANRGYNTLGIDLDKKEIAEATDYFKKYLENARYKYTRRQVSQTVPGASAVPVTVFDTKGVSLSLAAGDSALADRVYTKTKVDCVVCDLPYGVQHAPGRNDTFEAMLSRALPAWGRMLAPGGAVAVSMNTFTFPRDKVRAIMEKCGFEVMAGGIWDGMSHWVEQAVIRDAAVCVKK